MQYACKTARRVIQLKYAIHSHTHTQSHSHSYSFACLGSGIIIRSTLSILRSLQMPIIFSFSVIIYQVNACTWHGYFRSTYCSPSHSFSLLLSLSQLPRTDAFSILLLLVQFINFLLYTIWTCAQISIVLCHWWIILWVGSASRK